MWPDWPLRVLIIDELATLTMGNKKLAETLTRIASQGRKSAHTIIAATQHPSVEVVPQILRSQFVNVLGLRVQRPEQNNVFFGQGVQRAAGIDLSKISKDHRGRGVWNDGTQFTHVRTFGLWETPTTTTGSGDGPTQPAPGRPSESSTVRSTAPLTTPLQLVPESELVPQDRFWRVLDKAPPQGFTVAELAERSAVPLDTVYRWVKNPRVAEVRSIRPKTYAMARRAA